MISLNFHYLVYKHKDYIWRNYMIYMSFEFQKKWSEPLIWKIDKSHRINISIFLTELIIEIDNISNKLLLLFLIFSKKNLIHSLTEIIDQYLINKNTYNFSPSNYSFPLESSFLQIPRVTPSETTNINVWFGKPIKASDEIFVLSQIDINYSNNTSEYKHCGSDSIFAMDEDYDDGDNMQFLIA